MGLEQSKLRHSRSQEDSQTKSNAFERVKSVPDADSQPATSTTDSEHQSTDPQQTEKADPQDVSEQPELTLEEQREYVRRLRLEQGQPVTAADFPPVVGLDEKEGVVQEDESNSDSDSDISEDSDSDSDFGSESANVAVEEVSNEKEGAEEDADAPPATKHETVDPIVLPPISQLGPSDTVQLQPIGRVHSIVDQVVLVEQLPLPSEGAPAFDVLDTESLLCFEDGRVLGLVYETFGSVKHPMYSVRFPHDMTIDKDTVRPDRTVYYLPSSSTYVHAGDIRSKGSDASNMWDEEVAADELEYSDDEEEAAAKRSAKEQRSSRAPIDPETASLGPLGGYDDSRKRKDKPQPRMRGKRARGGANVSFTGPMPRHSAPHINPRFAGQLLRGMPYPYMMPPGFPMPMSSVPQNVQYDPRVPSVITPHAQPMPPGMPPPRQPEQP